MHKLKYDKDGKFERARSRLTPHGFRQIPGVDDDEDGTFAPTLSVETAMLMLAIQVYRNMHMAQLDVESAF